MKYFVRYVKSRDYYADRRKHIFIGVLIGATLATGAIVGTTHWMLQ